MRAGAVCVHRRAAAKLAINIRRILHHLRSESLLQCFNQPDWVCKYEVRRLRGHIAERWLRRFLFLHIRPDIDNRFYFGQFASVFLPPICNR